MKSRMKTLHGSDQGNQGKNGGIGSETRQKYLKICKREGSTVKD